MYPSLPVLLFTFVISLTYFLLFAILCLWILSCTSCTSLFHHQVSLSSLVCQKAKPNAPVLSDNSLLPPRAFHNSSLNSEQHSAFSNFHRLILASAFTHFLFLLSKAILLITESPPVTFYPATTLQFLISFKFNTVCPSFLFYIKHLLITLSTITCIWPPLQRLQRFP